MNEPARNWMPEPLLQAANDLDSLSAIGDGWSKPFVREAGDSEWRDAWKRFRAALESLASASILVTPEGDVREMLDALRECVGSTGPGGKADLFTLGQLHEQGYRHPNTRAEATAAGEEAKATIERASAVLARLAVKGEKP